MTITIWVFKDSSGSLILKLDDDPESLRYKTWAEDPDTGVTFLGSYELTLST